MQHLRDNIKKIIAAGIMSAALLITPSAWAAVPGFTDLSPNEVEDIVSDFSAIFTHTTVSPASSLGKIFGFQFGLVAGTVETPGVEALSKEFDPSSDVKNLYHAGLMGQLSVPFGITAEAVFFPKKDIDNVSIQQTSLAVKWTMTDTLLSLPVDLALRAHHSLSKLSYTQEINSVDAGVDIDVTVTGLNLVASKSFILLEPYVGLGVVQGKGDIDISGNDNFFNYTASQSESKTVSGSQFFAGVNVNLLIVNVGIEVGKVFDSQKISAKLAMGF